MSLAERLTPNKPRVLTVDIETSPHLCFSYDLWNTNITPDKIVEPSRILCWAGKWLGESKVMYYGEHTHTREQMISALWDALDEADVLITYNGVKFDVPHIMREFITRDYLPPSPWIDIDLLQVARRRFKFASNRLGYVTSALNLPTKLETGVAQLWLKVLHGDDKAWKKFEAYNKRDVIVTELLYCVLLPWMKAPHAGLWSGDMSACPSCGSTSLTPTGMTYTKTAAWVKAACDCGAWCKVMANGQTRPI